MNDILAKTLAEKVKPRLEAAAVVARVLEICAPVQTWLCKPPDELAQHHDELRRAIGTISTCLAAIGLPQNEQDSIWASYLFAAQAQAYFVIGSMNEAFTKCLLSASNLIECEDRCRSDDLYPWFLLRIADVEEIEESWGMLECRLKAVLEYSNYGTDASDPASPLREIYARQAKAYFKQGKYPRALRCLILLKQAGVVLDADQLEHERICSDALH